ncbi:hypothetical protein C8J57DRAFT_1564555 [Mycena rebaudengoi]|nr:hypothetical protein C8J57DRAFT_1564555 [Mycena rebaudengoi]
MDDDRALQDTLNMTSTTSELRSRLGAIEQRWLRWSPTDWRSYRLREERGKVLADLDTIVYPVLALPPKITSEIFVRYMDDSHAQIPILPTVLSIGFHVLATSLTRSSFDGPSTIPLLNSPLLRELCLEGIDLAGSYTSLPWNQLTTLELYLFGIGDCLKILERTPNLERLVFEPGWLDPEDTISSPPRILPHLHGIDVGSEGSPAILGHLILPSLDHVALSLSSVSCERLERLIERSGCSPRTLELRAYEEGLAVIHECILESSSFRKLLITGLGGSSRGLNHLCSTLADDASVLPSLESFTIEDCQITVNLLPLVRMLMARTTGMHGVVRLNFFRLGFAQEVKYFEADDLALLGKEVEHALNEFRNLRSQGLELEIQSAFQWLSSHINSQMVGCAFSFVPHGLKFLIDQRDW